MGMYSYAVEPVAPADRNVCVLFSREHVCLFSCVSACLYVLVLICASTCMLSSCASACVSMCVCLCLCDLARAVVKLSDML